MTKIDIISGFLGSGKTTLIKKLVKDLFAGQNIVIIENEFGQIGIDGGFLKESGVNVTEMNSGCICCSLVGDFEKALKQVIDQFAPERIIIEPSGVGKLSDVITAVNNANIEGAVLNSFSTVVDAKKCKMYHKNFGEFFNNQISSAGTVILSHTADIDEHKLENCLEIIKELNHDALVVTTDWDKLSAKQLLDAIENKNAFNDEVKHHHEHHHHDEHCDCGCHEHHHEHHHHDEHCDCGCHEHHHEHHHHDEHCDCGCHEHHHEHHHHDEHCDCGCHEHHHEHHHHADEVFTSWSTQTTSKFSKEKILTILNSLKNAGTVLRAKGIVESECGWLHFDYIPENSDVREGTADVTGRVCVIGADIDTKMLEELFR